MTCDAEHEYKHAKVPRQRRKGATPAALYSQVLAGAPKRVAHDPAGSDASVDEASPTPEEPLMPEAPMAVAPAEAPPADDAESAVAAADDERSEDGLEEGPVHRPLIRATLPRPEGQAPPARPAPDFTIRQPGGGRPNRFRPRHQRSGGSGAMFSGNRSSGNVTGPSRNSGGSRFSGNGDRPPQGGGPGRRSNQQHRQNRKRFK